MCRETLKQFVNRREDLDGTWLAPERLMIMKTVLSYLTTQQQVAAPTAAGSKGKMLPDDHFWLIIPILAVYVDYKNGPVDIAERSEVCINH